MNIDFPQYNEQGLALVWEDNFQISCSVNGAAVCIQANGAGLVSLARHMLELAQDNAPEFSHIHLDSFNSLEEGSAELIIIKKSSTMG